MTSSISVPPGDLLQLLDWKRSVSALYAMVRGHKNPVEAWSLWRAERAALFAQHPQSPLPAEVRAEVTLEYFGYDPALRVLAETEVVEGRHYEIATSGDLSYGFTHFASAHFGLEGHGMSLELYWLDGYGGGLLLPFRDATSGESTYGAGRYLLDTVKGADLGLSGGRIVLDFNFAYNPSCVYDPAWVCPLAPPANRLPVSVQGGEQLPGGLFPAEENL
ncbi:MAG: DUF1684 domain-containing protein [Actinomycetota bacterium]|nr:DUF1684 domain-containing protein [Actinomycetota bacterium]